jgi:two-component system response regulator EvgA
MPRSILIVDDHPGFRQAARALLEAEGFTVVGEASDGEAALAEAERLRPAVVLLDVQLPDIDGFQVATALAAMVAPPEVVLISSRDRASYGPQLTDAPVAGFLPKSHLTGEAIRALMSG